MGNITIIGGQKAVQKRYGPLKNFIFFTKHNQLSLNYLENKQLRVNRKVFGAFPLGFTTIWTNLGGNWSKNGVNRSNLPHFRIPKYPLIELNTGVG